LVFGSSNVEKVPWEKWEKWEKNRFKSWNFGKMVGNGKTDIYSKSNPEIGEVWRSLDMFCR
jgi:hypothetical protein